MKLNRQQNLKLKAIWKIFSKLPQACNNRKSKLPQAFTRSWNKKLFSGAFWTFMTFPWTRCYQSFFQKTFPRWTKADITSQSSWISLHFHSTSFFFIVLQLFLFARMKIVENFSHSPHILSWQGFNLHANYW